MISTPKLYVRMMRVGFRFGSERGGNGKDYGNCPRSLRRSSLVELIRGNIGVFCCFFGFVFVGLKVTDGY